MLLTLFACVNPDLPTPPGASSSWIDGPMPNVVLARRFAVVDPPGPASVRCTLASDPAEVHQVTGDHTADLVIYGLLADEDYDCELLASGQPATTSFHTQPLPDWLPQWTVMGATRGYTVFNHGTDQRGDRQAKILIVDPEGRLRWYYDVPYDAADLDVSYLGDGLILYGGGYSAPPSIVELSGILRFRAPAASTGRPWHHSVDRLPDGSFVALAAAGDVGVDEDPWTGATIELLDPALTTTTSFWRTQRGYDEGWLPTPPADVPDPYHLNSVAFADDHFMASFRHLSLTAKLDQTGAKQWLLGPGGDFTLVDENGDPDDEANWIYGPHAPEFHGNRILFYDNGWGRPGGSFSRVVELVIDEEARTAQVTWQYTESGWYEPIWGDVDELPDGNVLYTRAHCGNCTPAQLWTTEIVEVDRTLNAAVWRLTMADIHDAGYRAERIDACAIFANQRYCPSLSTDPSARK